MASTLTVDNIVGATSASIVHAPGHVIQVKQSVFTGVQTISGSSFTDITSLAVTITPTATNSKFLLAFNLGYGAVTNAAPMFRFTGGNSGNFIGDADGSRNRAALYMADDFGNGSAGTFAQMAFMASHQYLDTPNTGSAITYKVQGRGDANGGIYINRTHDDVNSSGEGGRGAASITVMEIAQ